LDSYAERFAAAGYVVVVFDYRCFGDSEGEPRQLLNVKQKHADWKAALQFARTLPGTDSDQIVAWGTSFGGGHVITLAGQGEQLAAIIAQVPHISGPAAVRATISTAGIVGALRVTLVGARDVLRVLLRRQPAYIASVGLPGQVAVMTSPDAMVGLDHLIAETGRPPDEYPQTVAARIVLRIGFYSPGRVARAVKCPALVQIAERDAVTPHGVAMRAARRMRQPTVHSFDCGHFDPYVDPTFSTVVTDQLAFLRLNVPVTRSD
jgi:alpha-beta hydrolase superfamily lysophospholipase